MADPAKKCSGLSNPYTNFGRRNLARLLLASGRATEALTAGEIAQWTNDSARVTARPLSSRSNRGGGIAAKAKWPRTGVASDVEGGAADDWRGLAPIAVNERYLRLSNMLKMASSSALSERRSSFQPR